MRIWKIEQLARELALGQVSEKSGMYYFLASSLLILLATYYAMWWGASRDWLFYFELVVLSAIAIVGCLQAYESNGGDNGQEFVLRAVCLSVPAGVRVNVFSLAFGLLLFHTAGSVFTPTSFADPVRAYTIVSYAGFVAFSVYFWWLLVRGMKQAREVESTT